MDSGSSPPQPKFPVDEKYKPQFSNELPCDIVLRELTCDLINNVFSSADRNKIFAQSLYSLRRLQYFEIKDAYSNEWASDFVIAISKRNIEEYFWLICDPRTSQVELYSDQVRNLLKTKGVTFPGLSRADEERSTQSVEGPVVSITQSVITAPVALSRSSTNNGSLSAQERPLIPKNQSTKLNKQPNNCFSMSAHVLLLMLPGITLLVTLTLTNLQYADGRHNGTSNRQIDGNISSTRPGNEIFINASSTTTSTPAWTKLSGYASEQTNTFQSESTTVSSPTKKPKTDPVYKNQSKPLYVVKLKNAYDYEVNLGKICNRDIRKSLVLSGFSSYTYKNLSFDCGSRIEGITLDNSGLFIDEVATILNLTSNIKNLQINGPEICFRNLHEGSRRNTINEHVSLKNLRHLEFNNLTDLSSSNADCQEIFGLVASNTIVNYDLISLSFSQANFTRRNSLEVTHLIRRALESERFAALGVFHSYLNFVMFNEKVLIRRNLSEVLINITNYYSRNAQLSLFNLLNDFLYFSTCDTFKTNVPMPIDEFKRSVPSINRLRVSTLVIPVYVDKCDFVSFEFMKHVQTVNNLNIKLAFSSKCKILSQKNPILLKDFQFLNNSTGFHKFQIVSNANFRVLGSNYILCREFKKTQRKLILHRNHIC